MTLSPARSGDADVVCGDCALKSCLHRTCCTASRISMSLSIHMCPLSVQGTEQYRVRIPPEMLAYQGRSVVEIAAGLMLDSRVIDMRMV